MLEDDVEEEDQINPELMKCIKICSRCQGAGSRGMDKCNHCDGTGRQFVVNGKRFPLSEKGEFEAYIELKK